MNKIKAKLAVMGYLERNAEVIEEIRRSVLLVRGESLEEDHEYTGFYAGGFFDSSVLRQRVYLGFKERPSEGDYYYKARAASELAILDIIYKEQPKSREKLPLFYGLVKGEEGKYLAIVTEDFTQGGLLDVFPQTSNGHEEVVKLFNYGRRVIFEFQHMCFQTSEGNLKYGDFFPATFINKADEDFMETVYTDLDRYTITNSSNLE